MAGQATIQVSLQIASGALSYRSNPTGFNTVVNATSAPKGPSPGAITVPYGGVSVDLSQLSVPGWCWLQNLDAAAYVEYGIYDETSLTYYPLGLIPPGTPQLIYLSPNLGVADHPGTGTHSSGHTTKLFLKAFNSTLSAEVACDARVDAFEA